ncbi:hypothetical protein RHGRI_031988 [Rhododendron griersonianum]|uniref:ABC-2 type transporter transmembrane domain-containing protein n=1 Tax=Rhododendron griersonianum TaxID=479676 RepID=A0AAV6ICI6_9ERIC|nr:hypothetical protein RHGRI_031988 [Rhododendron griersonianum]
MNDQDGFKLLVLKNGGRIIYSGPLGQHSSFVIKYFEDVPGVQKIRDNYNPATWILEVTSTTAEAELGIDFAQVYKNSLLYQNNKALVITLSAPPDSKELHFTTRFSQNGWGQFKSCLWKQHLSYWRSPSYNLMRSMYLVIASLLFGILFWDQGRNITNQQSLFNVLGAMYSASIFLGINNCTSVLPYVSTERSVLYRERFAGMYGSWAYALAQVTIEVPYLLAQAIVFLIITYPMIGYYWSAYKVFWYFYAMFCTLLYFTYLGMLLIAMTPSFPVAAILQSLFYVMFNLFAGFLIPLPPLSLQSSESEQDHHIWLIKISVTDPVVFILPIAANSQVVGLDVLSYSNILDSKGYAYFTVWRYTEEYYGVW